MELSSFGFNLKDQMVFIEEEEVGSMRTPGGGGFKNWQNLADVFCR